MYRKKSLVKSVSVLSCYYHYILFIILSTVFYIIFFHLLVFLIYPLLLYILIYIIIFILINSASGILEGTGNNYNIDTHNP
nr:MAG TPA: hypothetical protein [Caudoviricetes sp.]